MTDTTPQSITLDENNCIMYLVQYTELAQSKGAFMLQEADLLKRGVDVLVSNLQDPEINKQTAVQLMIQGITKGQRHGAFTLADAALLFRVIQFLTRPVESVSTTSASNQLSPDTDVKPVDDDLSELSEPVPLKLREI